MSIRLALIPLVLLPACFDKCKVSIQSVEVLLLHSPDLQERFGIESVEGQPTIAEVYLLENDAPIEGRLVRLTTPSGSVVDLAEVEPGRYEAMSTDEGVDLTYEPTGSYTVTFIRDGETFTATAKAYAETTFASPAQGDVIPPGEDLAVSIVQDASSTLVAVYDQQGAEVYNSFPATSDEVLDIVTGMGGRNATIPGNVFREDQIYFLGAAGVRRSDWTDISPSLNATLSAFISGSLDAVAVNTAPWEAMGGIVWSVDGSALAGLGISLDSQTQALLYATRVIVEQGITSSPLTGGEATLTFGNQDLPLTEEPDEPGLYGMDSKDQPLLAYGAGRTTTFTFDDPSGSYTLTMAAPEAPVLDTPAPGSFHAPGEPLTLTTPTSHDLYFAVVVDALGNVVYDDLPDDLDVNQVLDGTLGTGPGEDIRIPGSLFTAAGLVYGVGLLGLEEMAPDGASENLNPTVSGMYVGTTTFTHVTTVGG